MPLRAPDILPHSKRRASTTFLCGQICLHGGQKQAFREQCGLGSVSESMDARELRERAEHYRRTALLVTDEDTSKALLELAERYAALARSLMQEEPPPSDDRDAGHGRR